MGGCKKSDHKRRDCKTRRMSRGHRSEHASDVDRRWPSGKPRRDATGTKRPKAEARAVRHDARVEGTEQARARRRPKMAQWGTATKRDTSETAERRGVCTRGAVH